MIKQLGMEQPEIWIIILDKETKKIIAERSTGFWGEVLFLKNRLKKDYENWIKQKAKNQNEEDFKSCREISNSIG